MPGGEKRGISQCKIYCMECTELGTNRKVELSMCNQKGVKKDKLGSTVQKRTGKAPQPEIAKSWE